MAEAAVPTLTNDQINQFILGTLPQMQPPKESAPAKSGIDALATALTTSITPPTPANDQSYSQGRPASGTPYSIPATDADVFSGGTFTKPGTPSPIDMLAAAGKPATSAPPVNGTEQPISQAQLSGSVPMPAPQAPAAPTGPNATNILNGPEVASAQAQHAANQQLIDRLQATGAMSPESTQRIIDLNNANRAIEAQLPGFVQAGALAKHLGDIGAGVAPTGDIAPLAGATTTAQQMAAATSEGTEGPKRLTQAVAPQQMRGAGASVVYPAGSPIAQQYAGLKQANALPPNVDIDQSGSVTINNTNPSSETIGKNFETLDAMEKQANDARLAQYQAGLLKNTLNAIGTSGPLTQHLGDLSAMAQQAGVDPKVLAAINIPSAPNIQEANAVAKELLGSVLRATFPGRITNTDIATMSPSSPNVNMLNEASNYLIDKIILPKTQRDIARYGFATTLPQNDTQVFKKNLYDWDQNNSYDKFVAPPEGSAPPGTATPAAPSVYHNPKTGQIIELRNGQWVDQQTGQAVQ